MDGLSWYIAPRYSEVDGQGSLVLECPGFSNPVVAIDLAGVVVHAYRGAPDNDCLVGATYAYTPPLEGWAAKTLAEALAHFALVKGRVAEPNEVY